MLHLHDRMQLGIRNLSHDLLLKTDSIYGNQVKIIILFFEVCFHFHWVSTGGRKLFSLVAETNNMRKAIFRGLLVSAYILIVDYSFLYMWTVAISII